MSSALGSTIGGIADADAPLTALYVTHYPALVGLARVLLRDHHAAEEVVQEAFIRVKASWRGMRVPDRAAAYLRSAVLNQARSRLRRSRVAAAHAAVPAAADRALPGFGDPVERAVAADERANLLHQIRSLPDRQRDCVVLRYYLDLSEAEMAETLGISKGSVKT
ncbi:MAG: SigE family RNA polymerase sigma factor, partial [Actinobacteria bacterium]|nr:SigE family RNA polymerase sigma factor [Actinomycetota bacterium]